MTEPRAQSSIDHQQRRGVAWDIIAEALESYREFMLDDDYDAQGALDRIIKRMQERSAVHGERTPETKP
jgi:hypothetical protein